MLDLDHRWPWTTCREVSWRHPAFSLPPVCTKQRHKEYTRPSWKQEQSCVPHRFCPTQFISHRRLPRNDPNTTTEKSQLLVLSYRRKHPKPLASGHKVVNMEATPEILLQQTKFLQCTLERPHGIQRTSRASTSILDIQKKSWVNQLKLMKSGAREHGQASMKIWVRLWRI